MNATLLILPCALLATTPALADDLRVEYQRWQYDISGTVDARGDRIDLEDDVGMEPRDRNAFAARWDSDRSAWIPDLLVRYQAIDAAGSQTFTSSGPLPLPGTTVNVLVDADLSDAGVTLRYPWAGPHLRAYGGLTVKHLWGELLTRNEQETESTRDDVSQTYPLLHGAVEVPLGEHVTLNANFDWISAGGDRALEWRAGVDAWLIGPIGLTAAWQERRYAFDADRDRVDARLAGAVFGVYARWK